MYRTVIVDDEPLFLSDFCDAIGSKPDQFSIVKATHNPEEVLEQFSVLAPDVVIADIKMPGLGGIELFRRIRRDDDDVVLVLVSGYSDFSLAQQALRVGVDDYITKPVTIQSIGELLARMAPRLVAVQKQRIGRCLRDGACNTMPAGTGTFFTLLFLEGHSSVPPAALKNEVTRLEQRTSGYWYRDVVPDAGRHLVACFSSGPKTTDINRSIEQIRAALRWVSRDRRFIVSGPFTSTRELHESVISLSKRVDEYLPVDRVWEHVDPRDSRPREGDLPLGHLEGTGLRSGSLSDTIHFLQSALTTCWDIRCSVSQALQVCERAINSLCHVLDIEIGTDREFQQAMVSMIVSTTDRAKALRSIDAIAEQYLSGQLHGRAMGSEALFARIERYLGKNVARSIRVSEVCKEFGLSRSRLNSLFHTSVGSTFLQHFTKMKIKTAAKKLVSLPEASVAEIAYSVGYEDPLYFSRVFRSVTGHAPSEFRKMANIGELDQTTLP